MRCQICGRSSIRVGMTKKLRGHINPTGKKWQRINLQWVTVGGKRIRACTRCIRTLSKKGKL